MTEFGTSTASPVGDRDSRARCGAVVVESGVGVGDEIDVKVESEGAKDNLGSRM